MITTMNIRRFRSIFSNLNKPQIIDIWQNSCLKHNLRANAFMHFSFRKLSLLHLYLLKKVQICAQDGKYNIFSLIRIIKSVCSFIHVFSYKTSNMSPLQREFNGSFFPPYIRLRAVSLLFENREEKRKIFEARVARSLSLYLTDHFFWIL